MKVSTTGYKANSKDKNEKQLFIKGADLTMINVPHKVKAQPVYPNGSYGMPTVMLPGVPHYSFPGAIGVIEEKLPQAQKGLPYGGAESLRWNTDFMPNFFVGNSMSEMLELNRRAKAMGWNSVEEYRNANWGANTKALEKNKAFAQRILDAEANAKAAEKYQKEYQEKLAGNKAQLEKEKVIYSRQQGILNDNENTNNVINRSELDKQMQLSADWEKSWYSKRAQLPQFKDIATQRLNHINDIQGIPWRDEKFKQRHPHAAAVYDPRYNTVNFPESQLNFYKRNPEYKQTTVTHERSHWYDWNYPQSMPNEGTDYNYNDLGQILGTIIPKEYSSASSSGTDSYLTLADIKKPFKTQGSIGTASGAAYYYTPTEIRARLNEWRRLHNIDPLKNYTNEEIQKIIDKDIRLNNDPNIIGADNANLDLYKLLRGRGDLLKQLNDRFVSNDTQNQDELPKAQTLGEYGKPYTQPIDFFNLDFTNIAPPVSGMTVEGNAMPYSMMTPVVGNSDTWVPLPSWSESDTYKMDLKNANSGETYQGYLQNQGDGKLATTFPVDMPAWKLPQMTIKEPLNAAGRYAKEFMTQNPDPNSWGDSADPNSPVTESILGNLLGIGKTSTNPYTGQSWGYYNRKTNWQNAKNDYIAEKLLAANPQGGRTRQQWLSSFDPNELQAISQSRKYSGEIAANRWAEGVQGAANSVTSGFLSPGAGIINLLPESMRPSAPNLFPENLSAAEAKDANLLNSVGMLAIPAEGVKGWIMEGSGRGWKGQSPIDYTGGRDVVTDIAGEVVLDPLNLTGVGILKGLKNVHAGILDDIIAKSINEAGKLDLNPVETFVRHAQREGIIPAGTNVKTLVDNPNLLNTVVTRGVKNNLTVGRRVTPSAGAGVAESSSGTITDLAKGDAAALSRFTGDPVGEAFYMGTHIPRDAYGMRSGLQSLPYDLDALYFDAPGKFARQTRATPNNYGDFTITSRIPFEYTTDPQQMVADYLRRLETAKPMSGGVGAKPGDLFGELHGVGANESAIVGKPGQQVLEPVSVSTIADYNKPLDEFDELFKLSKENPEKFKAAFWEKANSGQLARTKQELGLSEDAMFLDPLYGIGDNPTLNELRFALRADANNKQLALAANAPIQKTNFSPLTTSFGNSAPVELTASQANRRLSTAQKQFDVLNKRGYENLSSDELLDAFRLEHEIKNLSTQVNKSTGTTTQVVDDAGRVGASDDVLGLPESRYKQMMKFFTMPDSKSKSGQNMLAEFQQRIRTPEGQRRLNALGISNPHIFEGLVIKEMQNELGYFDSNSGLEYMALHKDIPEEIAAKITRHELEHAVQRALGRKSIPDPNNPRIPWLAKPAGTTEIDDILGNLTFKGKPSSTFTPRLHSEEPIVFPANQELFPSAQRNLDYFVHGSSGKERSAFLAEVQQSLVDDKLVDNVYQNITPEKVKEAYNLYMKNTSSDKYPLRLFEIIEPTEKNFQDISTGLNKMLGIVPLTGIGIGVGATMQQKKKGGNVNKRNNKALDDYFTQAWASSRKSS
jgi:hypothetical protein